MRQLVTLDRDGTINVEKGFLGDPADVELLPGAGAAVRRLNRAGCAVAVATNQSGVARGYYTLAEMEATNARVREALRAEGAEIDAFEFCPHHPDATVPEFRAVCDCRKPGTGMARRAAEKLGVRAEGAAVIGDRLVDVGLGLNLSGPAILVLTGAGAAEREEAGRAGLEPSAVVPDLKAAVEWLLARQE